MEREGLVSPLHSSLIAAASVSLSLCFAGSASAQGAPSANDVAVEYQEHLIEGQRLIIALHNARAFGVPVHRLKRVTLEYHRNTNRINARAWPYRRQFRDASRAAHFIDLGLADLTHPRKRPNLADLSFPPFAGPSVGAGVVSCPDDSNNGITRRDPDATVQLAMTRECYSWNGAGGH